MRRGDPQSKDRRREKTKAGQEDGRKNGLEVSSDNRGDRSDNVSEN
jgi:hypothetical protein